MALTTSLSLRIAAALTNALDLSTPRDDLEKTISMALTSGTGADQADQIWHDQRTLSSGANEDLDLAGSLTNPLGVSVALARAKLIIFYAASGNTTNLTVGPKASNGFAFLGGTTPTFALVPKGVFMLFNPSATALAVTAGTGDLITVTNAAGASATYGVIIVGATA